MRAELSQDAAQLSCTAYWCRVARGGEPRETTTWRLAGLGMRVGNYRAMCYVRMAAEALLYVASVAFL